MGRKRDLYGDLRHVWNATVISQSFVRFGYCCLIQINAIQVVAVQSNIRFPHGYLQFS
jgi:hypothetical protein